MPSAFQDKIDNINTPDAPTYVPVRPHAQAEPGKRQKVVLTNRQAFPAEVEDTGNRLGGMQLTRDKDLASLLAELIVVQREMLEFLQDNLK